MPQKIMEAYYQSIDQGDILYSQDQLHIIKKLQQFDNKISIFSKPKGIYLYGEVGRGKSFLVDLYFNNSKIKRRKRIHFHEFMQTIHYELRQFKHVKDPLLAIGKKISKEIKLLFLDELHIHDIGYAMILSRLFTSLFYNKIYLMITSNYHPQELYKDGLQRENFLPAIELIEKRMQILKISGDIDYRLRHQSLNRYLINDEKRLLNIFLEKIGNLVPHKKKVMVNGRTLYINKIVNHIAWFTFDELCRNPLAAADYQAIIKELKIIFISNIPIITDLNEMKRLIMLIDEIYENKVELFCESASEPNEICSHPEFKRAASRLIEMCSK